MLQSCAKQFRLCQIQKASKQLKGKYVQQIPQVFQQYQQQKLKQKQYSSSANTQSGGSIISPDQARIAQNYENRLELPVIVETKGVPVVLYANPNEVERDALDQLIMVAESPLPVGYVSAMPDVHLGKGVTIGSVFASDKYVCPNAVGVDIGCGMCAVPIKGLHKDDLSQDQKVTIQKEIKRRVPTGFNEYKRPLQGVLQELDQITHQNPISPWLTDFQSSSKKVGNQIGTLGGGNHFMEIVHDETGQVWVFLHSGSRNVGNTTATRYDDIAGKQVGKMLKGRNKGERKVLKPTSGLNYLEIDSDQGQAYLGDMKWCQAYAMENRRAMLHQMINVVEEVTKKGPDMSQFINIHHNYCNCERCTYKDFKTGNTIEKDVWVTRKGATSAQDGQFGLIPGSMGTGSYIVRGKGNPMSWNSCSHGAGRRMSRAKAFKSIGQAQFEELMKGIVCDTHPLVKDEAPQAYKDLLEVMQQQSSLVDIIHNLKPLINVKGYGKK